MMRRWALFFWGLLGIAVGALILMQAGFWRQWLKPRRGDAWQSS